MNRVSPSLIRVYADEVTYNLHVMVRFGLEQELLEGKLPVRDLPEAWNEGYRKELGITPPDNKDGVMQDIHWPDGAFGYFPTYTLGAMAAAQLAAAARRADPDIMPAITRGDFTPLMAWLRRNVHQQGSLLSTDELLRQATGGPLDATAFTAHLGRRYLGES